MTYNYIAIEGNIGSGKTTLAKKLSESLGYNLILEEFEDNSYLPKFYEDPDRNAFPLEMSFLAERYKQLRSININNGIVSDYIFDKSWLFASINLEDAEAKIYHKVFKILNTLLPKPDLIVLLESISENLLNNIAERGREYEMNIKSDYLDKIGAKYKSYFSNQRFKNIIHIDTNVIDLNKAEDYNNLLARLTNK
ncbi:deoxynucleoside kinase [Bacteroidota bacterium]